MDLKDLKFLHESRKERVIEYIAPISTIASKEFWYRHSPSKQKVPTLVAHIDTVHENRSTWQDKEWRNGQWVDTPKKKLKPRRVFYDDKAMVMWSPDGLGADDRAGVWAILKIYDELPDELKPNLLFTDKEESGGLGAKAAVKEIPKQLANTLFYIQIDRKNSKEAIFYNDEPKEFEKFISTFGFIPENGTFTDISVIGKEFKICGANLSAGYYENHTSTEHLYVTSLLRTVEKTKNIVTMGVKLKKCWTNPNARKYVAATSPVGYGGQFGFSEDEYWAGVVNKNAGGRAERKAVKGFSRRDYYGTRSSERADTVYPFWCPDRRMMIESYDQDVLTSGATLLDDPYRHWPTRRSFEDGDERERRVHEIVDTSTGKTLTKKELRRISRSVRKEARKRKKGNVRPDEKRVEFWRLHAYGFPAKGEETRKPVVLRKSVTPVVTTKGNGALKGEGP